MASEADASFNLGQVIFGKVDLGPQQAAWMQGVVLDTMEDNVLFGFVPPEGVDPSEGTMVVDGVKVCLASGPREQLRLRPPQEGVLSRRLPPFKLVYKAFCATAVNDFLTLSAEDGKTVPAQVP